MPALCGDTTPPENQHDNGTSTIWRCVSYWTWGFFNVVLVFRGVLFPEMPNRRHWQVQGRICDSHRSICSILKFKLLLQKSNLFWLFSEISNESGCCREQQKFENLMGRVDSKASHIQFSTCICQPRNLRLSPSGDKKCSHWGGAYFWKGRGRWTGENGWNLFIGTLPETNSHRNSSFVGPASWQKWTVSFRSNFLSLTEMLIHCCFLRSPIHMY